MKSANLTFEDICDIRAIFDYLDSDADGTLSDSEALKVWSIMGLPARREDVEDVPRISYQRFCKMTAEHYKRLGGTSEDSARRLFRMIDSRSKGVVNTADLRSFLTSVRLEANELHCLSLIEQLSTDHLNTESDEITSDEFVEW